MNARHDNNTRRRILALAVEPLESRRLLSYGALDPTFGAGGKVLGDLGGLNPGNAMTVSAGGKILVAGTLEGDFVVARYNSTGSLDTTFGNLAADGVHHTGYATVDFHAGADQALAITVQDDGKIVVAGQAQRGFDYDFGLARLNADGSLDSTFGTGGKVSVDFLGGSDQATGVAVQPDGRIVVSGMATDLNFSAEFALLRLTTAGALDNSFGAAGKVHTAWANAYAESTALALQSDGRIVLVGYASDYYTGTSDAAVARYTANGALDTSFGTGGLVKVDFSGSDDTARAVTVDALGRIVLAGYSNDHSVPEHYDFVLARLAPGGAVDTSLGDRGDGLVLTDFAQGDDRAFAVTVQPDGKILLAGHATFGGHQDLAVVRYHADGSLDSTFGPNHDGRVTFDLGPGWSDEAGEVPLDDTAVGVVFNADESIVLAGVSRSEQFGLADFALVRLAPPNLAPVANAGGPYHGNDLAPISLSGASSFDLDGHIVKWEWDFDYDGSFNADALGETVEFHIDGDAYRTVALRVTDDKGATHLVTTTVKVDNVAPVANAGTPKVITDLQTLTLSAGNSYDLDGAIVKYEWDFSYDGTFNAEAEGVSVDFLPPNGPTHRIVALRVTDNDGATHLVTVRIDVENVAPVANPGGPYVLSPGGTLTLDGSGSTDADATPGTLLKYEWDFNYAGGTFDVDATGAKPAWTKTAAGTYTIALRVTDEDGAVHVEVTTVEVKNAAPVANAGSPKVITEGTDLTLSGAKSTDDGKIVKYEWDFDYDGTFTTDATGVTAAFPKLGGPVFRTVALRVTDDNGVTHLVTTTVNVENAAPVASVSGPAAVRKGQLATFTGSFFDPAGDLDTYEVSWDFGDGTVTGFGPAGEGQSVKHVFERKGTYVVTFTVRDDSGATASATTTIEVKAGHVFTETTSSGALAMTIMATESPDAVTVKKAKRSNLLEVTVNGENEGLFQADRVIIYGSKGNDHIRVGEGVTQPVEVFGEDGNDVIFGGTADATLHGGNGNDKLFGGDGRNCLHGGEGDDHLEVGAKNKFAASLYGGNGNDDLFGGAGRDLLSGGDGRDHLNGRGGADTLLGGAGKDSRAADKADVWEDPDEKAPAPKAKKK